MRGERTEGVLRIAYDDAGTGEPALLLLPGWCSSRERWRAAGSLCAERRRVISLEWRGHGDSAVPAAEFGAAELLEDAVAVIDATGIRTFVPCSASHAGWIAIGLRRRYGERVPRLVHADWMVTRPPEAFGSVITELASGDWKAAQSTLFAIWAAGSESPEIRKTLAIMAEHDEAMWRRAGREILAAYSRCGSPLEALASLTAPPEVLHLYGQPQTASYLEEQTSFAAAHPWFSVRKLDTVTHFSMVESPLQVALAIEQFVESR